MMHCTYGFPGERARRCRAHRLAGMVRRPRQARRRAAHSPAARPRRATPLARSQADVASKMCAAAGCKKRPLYGFPGERPLRCKPHALEGMVRVPPAARGALMSGGRLFLTQGRPAR